MACITFLSTAVDAIVPTSSDSPSAHAKIIVGLTTHPPLSKAVIKCRFVWSSCRMVLQQRHSPSCVPPKRYRGSPKLHLHRILFSAVEPNLLQRF